MVHIGQADRADYQQTLVVDLEGTAKGSPVWWLARILRVNSGNVLSAETPSDEADLRVIVGYDYLPCYKSYWFGVHTTPTPTPPPTPAP